MAELGAAFHCVELTIRGDVEHQTSYLQDWLTVLKQDKMALFRAAADASCATEIVHALQPATRDQAA